MTDGDDEDAPYTPDSAAGQPERMNFTGDVRNVFHISRLDGDVRANSEARRVDSRRAPQQLPPDASEFHNHRDVLAALSSHPRDRPQVEVIVGQPGVGKSALAVHWANLVGGRFADGRSVERATAHLDDAAEALEESIRLFQSVGALNRASDAQRELDGLGGPQ